MKKNKPIAIIPARIGSKRIHHKNIVFFKNKPLIYWTVKSAINSKIFEKIFISTDSIIILKKIKSFKEKISFLSRPKKFSGSKTKTSTLIKFLIKKNSLNEKYRDFFLLQPTSPLRTRENIIESWETYQKFQLNNLTSISRIKNDYLVKGKNNIFYKNKKKINIKNKKFYLNGSIYINNLNDFVISPDFFKNKKNFFIMNKNVSLDIDTLNDLK